MLHLRIHKNPQVVTTYQTIFLRMSSKCHQVNNSAHVKWLLFLNVHDTMLAFTFFAVYSALVYLYRYLYRTRPTGHETFIRIYYYLKADHVWPAWPRNKLAGRLDNCRWINMYSFVYLLITLNLNLWPLPSSRGLIAIQSTPNYVVLCSDASGGCSICGQASNMYMYVSAISCVYQR